MNNVVLSGRLTKKPELRSTTSGMMVCSFSLAVRRDKEKTDFIDCVCFGKTAENLVKYQDKGSMIELTGRLENNSYTDNEGKKHFKTNICVEMINYISQGQTNDNGVNNSELQSVSNPYEEMRKKVEEDYQLPF